ncbi:transporter substrate-binding domain-containing protein [Pseudomonas sp. DC3000-4b1]|uniref:transporter substrate-binding domain-containing protein n=2 Tax=unclassified Pseudomonas TaxID=196821 RepID=UPI003CF397C9
MQRCIQHEFKQLLVNTLCSSAYKNKFNARGEIMVRAAPRFINIRLARAALVAATLSAATVASAAGNSWQDVQKAGVLRCGAAVAAPYVMRDAASGQYSGYFVDLCRDFGENVLKVKVQFVDTSWDNQVAGIQSGKWDMAMALNPTPERALAVGFSTPAVDYSVSLMVNKENPKFAAASNRLADYDKDGVTIAVMSGTSADKALSREIQHAKIMRLPGLDETRMALISRRADVLADASDTNRLFIRRNDWAKEVALQPALAKQGIAFGVARDMPVADQQVLNIYLQQRRDAGDIDKLVEKANAQLAVAGRNP